MLKRILSISIVFIVFVYDIDDISTGENNIFLEKAVCDEVNNEFIAELKCISQPIAPNVFKTNITIHLKKPCLDNFWLHSTLYYRYSTYQHFIHQTENICTPNQIARKLSLLNIVTTNFQKLGNLTFNHKCPFKLLMFTADGFNVSHFIMPLMPAGRYRFDMNVTKAEKNGQHMFLMQYSFRISDYRKWF